jgi:glycine cleavage system regulatory protein
MAPVTSPAELRLLLEQTTLPDSLLDEFLEETNALWLANERADVVAGEVVLCHPPLEPGEVRAVVKPTDAPARWRITVVTADRPGLLAATAGVLANQGLSVTSAAVRVLPTSRLCMERLTVEATRPTADAVWDDLGGRLRQTLGDRHPVTVRWKPTRRVTVTCHPQGVGRCMVQVTALDTPGLLWAVAQAICDHGGGNIEAARLSSADGVADDVFLVEGDVDGVALADALSTGRVAEQPSTLGQILTFPMAAGVRSLRRGADLLSLLGASPDRPR